MEVALISTVTKEIFSLFKEKLFLLLIVLAYYFNFFNLFVKDYSKTENIITNITVVVLYWIFYFLFLKLVLFFSKFFISFSSVEAKYYNNDFVNYDGESRFEWRSLSKDNESIVFCFNRKKLVEIDKDNLQYRYTDKAIGYNYNSTLGKNTEYIYNKNKENKGNKEKKRNKTK